MQQTYASPSGHRAQGLTFAAMVRAAILVLLVAATVPMGLTGLGIWLSPQDALHRADVLFVPNGDPDFARTRKAADLYRRGLAKRVMFSGRGVGGDSAWEMARLARDLGVPASAILLEDEATSTFENVTLSVPLLQRHKVRSVLVVSSPYHLRRIKLVAAAAWPGIEVRVCRDNEPLDDWWWTSSRGWRRVGLEAWKVAGYGIAGRYW